MMTRSADDPDISTATSTSSKTLPKASAPILKNFQLAYLRGQAHRLEAIVQVGDAGITEAVVKATDEALLQHELIKVRLRRPDNKKAMAAELAEKTHASLCGLIGHTVILYKEHPEKPQIHLPSRPA